MNQANQELQALKDELVEIHKSLDDALEANQKNFIDSLISHLSGHQEIADKSLLEELEEQAATITNNHPRLSGILREIADTLGKLGI